MLKNYLRISWRIDLRFSVLLLAGFAALLTALLVTGIQAARANPVNNLRSE